MVNTARMDFPTDMRRASVGEASGLETVACDLMDSVRDFVRAKPEAAALWALGIGFVLGWKLKPW